MKALLTATLAVAALLPMPASHASGARLCDTGEVGVVVFDDDGDVATVCVRRDVLDPVTDLAGRVVKYPGALAQWAGDEVPPHCWTQGEFIVCEQMQPPPRP